MRKSYRGEEHRVANVAHREEVEEIAEIFTRKSIQGREKKGRKY